MITLAHATPEASFVYSDPLLPPKLKTEPRRTSLPSIPARLNYLKEEIDKEKAKLEALPQLDLTRQFNEFGYHSDYLPKVTGVPEKPIWTLDFDLKVKDRLINGIVLVPAIDERSRELKGYGFPKRFKLSTINRWGEKQELFVDWTAEDFPNPGMHPVYFELPSRLLRNTDFHFVKGIRLEVFSGHEGDDLEYFALGRVHLMRRGKMEWVKTVSASSSFESEPYWSKKYLFSSKHNLGMPLAKKEVLGTDLMYHPEAARLESPLVIRIDIDKRTSLRDVYVFPALSPHGVGIPAFGFPRQLEMYRYEKLRSGSIKRHRVERISDGDNPGNNLVRYSCERRSFNTLEIVCNDFPVYQGKPTFSLGEIVLNYSGRKPLRTTFSSNLQTTANMPGEVDLSALSDGKVNGRKIIKIEQWIQELAKAKTHIRRLTDLESEYSDLEGRWKGAKARAGIALIVLFHALVLIIVLMIYRAKKKVATQLRRQICSDLHDDVGSKVAAIRLATQDIENHTNQDRVLQRASWISGVAGAMNQALRDVLWLTNDQTDTAEQLFTKLGETARQSVPEEMLTLKMKSVGDSSPKALQIQVKRDILFFFKEALSNALKHAEAEEISVEVSLLHNTLQLIIQDDGKGFSAPSKDQMQNETEHLGLKTMEKRARSLAGDFRMDSVPEVGTTISLRVKL